MSVSRWLVLFLCGAIAAGCGGAGGSKAVPDADARLVSPTGRPGDAADGPLDLVGDEPPDAAPADARPEAAGGDRQVNDGGPPDADAAGAEAGVPPRMCTAGHVCNGSAHCQRTCFDNLVYRCSCTEGRLVCTGCISVDGGVRDARSLASCGSGSLNGRHCDQSGMACQYASDAGRKLCVCGNLGPDRVWVCQ
jgi:hypothetical protein